MKRMNSNYGVLRKGLGAMTVLAVSRIVHELPSAMSGSKRTQHLGIYQAVIVLSEVTDQVNSKAVANFCGMAVSHVNAILKRLYELGVLDRVALKVGRTMKYLYHPAADLEAIRSMKMPSHRLDPLRFP